jgi:hypothetical protein
MGSRCQSCTVDSVCIIGHPSLNRMACLRCGRLLPVDDESLVETLIRVVSQNNSSVITDRED